MTANLCDKILNGNNFDLPFFHKTLQLLQGGGGGGGYLEIQRRYEVIKLGFSVCGKR